MSANQRNGSYHTTRTMARNIAGQLQFGVHLKVNQQLKYLNKGSAHTPACFKAISTGVCKRIAKLTTINSSNKDVKISDRYPSHFEALERAGLIESDAIPTLGDQQRRMAVEKAVEEVKQAKKKRDRD